MDVQKIGDVIRNLVKLRNKYGDVPAISSSDDEGNSYGFVYYEPTPGKFEEGEFDSVDDVVKEDINAVCIN